MAENLLDDPDIRRKLALLRPREEKVLLMRYGLDGHQRTTLREIGEKFGVTGRRISQIEKKALAKLRSINAGSLRKFKTA